MLTNGLTVTSFFAGFSFFAFPAPFSCPAFACASFFAFDLAIASSFLSSFSFFLAGDSHHHCSPRRDAGWGLVNFVVCSAV